VLVKLQPPPPPPCVLRLLPFHKQKVVGFGCVVVVGGSDATNAAMLVLYAGKEVTFALVEVIHERMGNMHLISQSQSHSLSYGFTVLCIDDGCCGCHAWSKSK
jgi:hypothetical protein